MQSCVAHTSLEPTRVLLDRNPWIRLNPPLPLFNISQVFRISYPVSKIFTLSLMMIENLSNLSACLEVRTKWRSNSKTCQVCSHSVFFFNAEGTFGRLGTILKGVKSLHLDLFKSLRHCSSLLKFFRENDFHSPKGAARFDSIREKVTLHIRSDPFKNSILNQFTLAHRCLAPFIQQDSKLEKVCFCPS